MLYVLFAIALFFTAVVVVLLAYGHEEPLILSNRRTHPPISDEEFVALCKPGTNPEVAIKVRHIISRNLNIPIKEIYPTDHFVDDLKAG